MNGIHLPNHTAFGLAALDLVETSHVVMLHADVICRTACSDVLMAKVDGETLATCRVLFCCFMLPPVSILSSQS